MFVNGKYEHFRHYFAFTQKKGDPIMQGMVLSFLSSATLEELTSMNGCSKKKAESVINMRPFESWEDLVSSRMNIFNPM